MGLSNDLISQFVRITNDKTKEKKETTVYGTVVEYNGSTYARLDGSDRLTPIEKTVNANPGDRVTIMIKNHSATITGNITSPAANSSEVNALGDKIGEFYLVLVDKADIKDLEAETARIDNLIAENATIKDRLVAGEASISDLEADNVDIKKKLTAAEADIEVLEANKLDANVADITYATIEDLDATNATIYNLESTYGNFVDLTTGRFTAVEADIQDLEAKKLSAEDAELMYANIDFTNIGKAAMEYFYAQSGLIENVVVGDQTITGNLVGVTISGDLIEGNTIVAEKLVIKGEDGLYYKLNTDGMTTEAEQTDYNSLNGQVIRAKTITATKIAVEDLVAFDATIGGFNISNDAIYSGVKESVDNTTRGIYLDRFGQMAVGDASNFIKYYKDEDGNYKLEISAKSLTFSTSNKNLEDTINEIQEAADAAIVSSVEQFYQSDYPTSLSGGEWSIVEPIWQDGKYIWRRTKVTYGNGNVEYTPSENGVCITGNTGASGEKGEDSTLLRIESSRGTVFKNDNISTVLSAVIYHGSYRITDMVTLKSVIGPGAYLQWKWQKLNETDYGVISADDNRLGNDGFTFTLSPEDVNTKVTFMCELIV